MCKLVRKIPPKAAPHTIAGFMISQMGGAKPKGGGACLLFGQIFPENCMKIKLTPPPQIRQRPLLHLLLLNKRFTNAPCTTLLGSVRRAFCVAEWFTAVQVTVSRPGCFSRVFFKASVSRIFDRPFPFNSSDGSITLKGAEFRIK